MADFDWAKSASYDDAQKNAFHRAATKQLKKLASELDFTAGTFEVRSNKAGPASSGEVTLHHEDLYVQVSQSMTGGPGKSIMIRTCEGRKDFSGGRNHFASTDWLNDGNMPRLVAFCGEVLKQKRGFDGDAHDRGYNPHTSTPTVAR
jgi:hypothetical protein